MGSRARQSAERIVDATPDDDIDLDDIQSLEAFTKRYPDIANEARLRWWIFHRQSNGLSDAGALIKRSGRWFVVVPRMKTWMLRSAQAA